MSDIAYAGTNPRPAGLVAKDMPLTAELKDRQESHIATANRIHNTLHQLRDRLFGSPPGNPAASGEQISPYSFSDAMRSLNSDLGSRLRDIEDLAETLAGRL